MKTLTVQAFTLPLMWVVILFLADGIHSQEMTPPAVRVLIVTGGHDFERIPFFEMFRGFEGIEFQEAVHPSADSLLNPGLRRSFDAVVFYDMPAETAERFKTDFVNLLNEGIGVVFLHHSIASYQTGWDGFEEILGGKYHEKAGEKDGKPYKASSYLEGVDVPIHVVNPRHPVTEGIGDFELRDEVYGNFEVLPGVRALLETGHPKSSRTIGWWHTYGKSTIVYLQPGHDQAAYTDCHFRRLVLQAIHFVSGESSQLKK